MTSIVLTGGGEPGAPVVGCGDVTGPGGVSGTHCVRNTSSVAAMTTRFPHVRSDGIPLYLLDDAGKIERLRV
jgi:hypothetical protein